MAYTSDQQLAAAGLRRLEDLPSLPGLRVVLRTRDGVDVDATIDVIIVDRLGGTDTVIVLEVAGDLEYEDFIGWRLAEPESAFA